MFAVKSLSLICALLSADYYSGTHCIFVATYSANVTLIGALRAFARRIRQEEDMEWVRKLREWRNEDRKANDSVPRKPICILLPRGHKEAPDYYVTLARSFSLFLPQLRRLRGKHEKYDTVIGQVINRVQANIAWYKRYKYEVSSNRAESKTHSCAFDSANDSLLSRRSSYSLIRPLSLISSPARHREMRFLCIFFRRHCEHWRRFLRDTTRPWFAAKEINGDAALKVRANRGRARETDKIIVIIARRSLSLRGL